MRVSIITLVFIILNVIIIKSQKPASIPWPPQVQYNGSQANWTQIAKTNYLMPREYQSVLYDINNNRLIIFGGRTANGTFLNDVWSWSFVANRFIQIIPGGASIPERSDFIAGVDVKNQRMYVFGGKNSKGSLGDFWYLSLVSGYEKWVQVCSGTKNATAPCNNLPKERWGGFGGSFVGPNYGKYFFVSHGKSGFQAVKSDTWVFNFETNVWKDITGADGDQGRFQIGGGQKSPFPRFGAASTMLGPNHLSIYGGCGAGGFGGCPAVDGWLMSYNEQTNKAEWLRFPSCPIMSYNGQAVPIPGTNVTTLNRYGSPMFFGGYGGNTGGGYHSENIFEIFDTTSSLTGSAKWARTLLLSLRNNPLQTPGGRTGASMVLVHPVDLTGQNTDFIVFFGGRDRHSTVRSDMWFLQGQSLLGRRFKCTSNTNYRMIHGILMFISFAGIFPITMMLARFGKDGFLPRLREKSPWLWVHGIANIVGCLVSIPGLVLAIVAVNTAHWTSIPHAYLGIIAFAFVMFNPIWGALRPDKDASSRAGWAYVHLWIGRLAVLLGFINMMLGILMIRASVVIFALYIVYLAIYFIMFITFFLLHMKKSGDNCAKALNPTYKSDKYDY